MAEKFTAQKLASATNQGLLVLEIQITSLYGQQFGRHEASHLPCRPLSLLSCEE